MSAPKLPLKLSAVRAKSKSELMADLNSLKAELAQLRVDKVTGGPASKVNKIKPVRRAIAKILTITHLKMRAEVKADLIKKNKKLALDLRPRYTRRFRRRLLPRHAAAMILSKKKRFVANPRRLYTIKA